MSGVFEIRRILPPTDKTLHEKSQGFTGTQKRESMRLSTRPTGEAQAGSKRRGSRTDPGGPVAASLCRLHSEQHYCQYACMPPREAQRRAAFLWFELALQERTGQFERQISTQLAPRGEGSPSQWYEKEHRTEGPGRHSAGTSSRSRPF